MTQSLILERCGKFIDLKNEFGWLENDIERIWKEFKRKMYEQNEEYLHSVNKQEESILE